jgi:serine/threonine-protein kinase
MIGKTISHYLILEKLGEGGMGEVYRARDSRLNREVALKVLPEAFAKAMERMARFQREPQVLALLNHPNIAAIHGMEESRIVKILSRPASATDSVGQSTPSVSGPAGQHGIITHSPRSPGR